MYKKALLVAAWGKGRERQDYLHPPLGLYRLKSGLEKAGVVCEVYDPNLSADPYSALLRTAATLKPDLVGFSSNHYSLPYDLSLAYHASRHLPDDVLLVGGGIGNTESTEQVLAYAPEGFVVVRGEGDVTLPDLCMKGDRSEVPGVAWREGGNIVYTDPRPAMDEATFCDVISGMDWESIPFEEYWKFLLRFHDPSILIEQNIRTARVIVSSYCPRGCAFCSSTNFYKLAGCDTAGKVHRLTPEDTVAILQRLSKAHPDVMNFFFHDDDFLFSAPWVKELCRLIVESKKEGSIPEFVTFMAQGSLRNIPKVVEDLFKADFRTMGLGVESFSRNVLKEFSKPQQPKHIHESIDALLNNNITPYVNLILSSPESNVMDLVVTLIESIKMLRRGASVAASVYTLAFPGADITSVAEAEGLVTYKDCEIEGTELVMKMTDRILPKDPHLRRILADSEAILDDLDREFFFGEGAFRSLLGPMTFVAISRSLGASGIKLPFDLRADLAAML